MTLSFLWNQYRRKCEASGKKFYQYRQFCERYSIWKEDNEDGVMHFTAVAGRSMEVDFAGQTFKLDNSVSAFCGRWSAQNAKNIKNERSLVYDNVNWVIFNT
ncbi:hypothetical protein [uncultured Treponema sp.]|uniref:hypothetical protein n=1 Tax=uncultured Treponema sp. TaxID=162155 RepID=UPI0025932D17|nr:hypothetical protein [uncultured Treponema sp.]